MRIKRTYKYFRHHSVTSIQKVMSNLKLTKCHIFASLLIFCIIISETKCEHLELTTANHDTVNIKITSEDSYQGIFTCIPILNSVQKNTLLYINPRPFKFQMAFWHTDIRWCDGNFDILKAMKSSPLHGPFCGSEFLRFSLLKILRVCIFLCFKLETIVSYWEEYNMYCESVQS